MTNATPEQQGWNFWDPLSNFGGNGVVPQVIANTPDVLNAVGQLGPFAGAASFFTMFARPDFWVRVGIFTIGAVLVIVGIVVLVSSSKTVGGALTAAGKAAKLTPVGAATSVVTEAVT